MAGSGTSILAQLVAQRRKNAKAALALGITPLPPAPPAPPAPAPMAPSVKAPKYDPEMMDHVTKFLGRFS